MHSRLEGIKLIPVLRKISPARCLNVVQALVDGGIKAVEVTMDSENPTKTIANLSKEFSHLVVGAGTVLTIEECEKAIDAGAAFVVSPVLNLDIIKLCVEKKIPVIPGVFTPTEMQIAYEAGAKMVKLFPASTLGPRFIKDVKGPLSHIEIMTTGGISLDTAKSYIDAGAKIVGAGSDLLQKKWIEEENWSLITKEAITWIDSLK